MRTRRAEAFWYEPLHRWQINVQRDGQRKTFTDSTPGRKGKHICEAKADKWLERFVSEQTISNALDLFLEDKAKRVGESTIKGNISSINKHIRPFFPPAKRLSAITEYEWQKCVDESGLKAVNSQKIFIDLICQFVHYCESRRWDIDPIKGGLHMTENAKKPKEKYALTAESINSLLAYNGAEDPLRNFFKLAVLTGCRKGELMDLRWNDVASTYFIIRKGKTASAARQVPLIPMAQQVIQDIRANTEVMSEYVFPNRYGEKISVTTVDKAWLRMRGKVDAEGYTIHELRHTFISVCKGQVNPILLKQAIGHSVNMDTYGVYGHTMEQDVIDTAEAASNAFDRVVTCTVQK